MPQSSTTHLHLDLVGGLAGDMFAAALLDARPDLESGLRTALAAAQLDRLVTVKTKAVDDGVLTGTGIDVAPAAPATTEQSLFRPVGEDGVKHMDPGAHGAHEHRSWADIRALFTSMTVAEPVRARALDIFERIAVAESNVHGVPIDDVGFHEVGAWDSIADIFMAAWLIDAIDMSTCSTSPLPLGRGRVETAHGSLPVPTPATALLLKGMPLIDDGIAGERITPTGAGILAHLMPEFEGSGVVRSLQHVGTGFGTRRMPGISNTVRAMLFDGEPVDALRREPIGIITFEVDDQTGEDLAVALQHLRAVTGVRDVCQSTIVGKKGRLGARIQVLCDPAERATIEAACLTETTTLGVRFSQSERTVLARAEHTTTVDGKPLRVKDANRPDGTTTRKAEIDDLADIEGHAQRERQRIKAERDTP